MNPIGSRALGTDRCGRLAMLAALASLLVSMPAAGQELPVSVQASLLKEQVIDALKSGNVDELFASMDEFRDVQTEGGATIPAGLFFAEAEAARSSKDIVRARRAYEDYLRIATPEDAAYKEALRAYGELRKSVPELIWETLGGMVPVRPGKFMMGDVAGTGDDSERPVHEVRLEPFSIGRNEVTRAQFTAFMLATGHEMQPADIGGDEMCDLDLVDWNSPGFEQSDENPVVCVNWQDAQAYIRWLNEQSDLRFRLPGEAEWEYAARAGTTTDYWYGDKFDPARENVGGTAGKDRWEAGTAPVGQFPPNPYGLHDMLGNVSEWLEECASENYQDASDEGSARRQGPCDDRAVRGGNWLSDGQQSRVSNRLQRQSVFRATYLGFRLVLGK